MWFPTRSDTNRAVQARRWLEILDLESRGIVLSMCENKGADQLRSYCEADLRLCFRLCRLLVFPRGGSFMYGECFMWCELHAQQTVQHILVQVSHDRLNSMM